jgi:protein-disulfide isomerase
MEEGKKIGVKSTPTFFVNGQLVSGAQPLEVFAEIIDEELAR